MSNLVLGSTITAISRFPVFLLTKEINIGVIFTRLEALIVVIWVITIFITTVIYFYYAVMGLSTMLKLKDYRKIVIPIGLIMSVYSGTIYRNVSHEMEWDTLTWLPYAVTFGIFIPLLLLSISLLKKK